MALKRTQLDRGTSRLARKTGMNPISKRRRTEWELRREVMQIVRDRDKTCQAARVWPEVACDGPLVGHEPLPRSRGGDPLNPDEVVLVCLLGHHPAIHANPLLAKERGLTR
jgi:hypothetical protein